MNSYGHSNPGQTAHSAAQQPMDGQASNMPQDSYGHPNPGRNVQNVAQQPVNGQDGLTREDKTATVCDLREWVVSKRTHRTIECRGLMNCLAAEVKTYTEQLHAAY